MDDGSDKKKAKGTKKCVIKLEYMFKNYKDCLFNEKTIFTRLERLAFLPKRVKLPPPSRPKLKTI